VGSKSDNEFHFDRFNRLPGALNSKHALVPKLAWQEYRSSHFIPTALDSVDDLLTQLLYAIRH